MNNIYTRPDEELFELMYLYLHKALTNAGYNFYEVSNFAKPGKKCTHNCNYWNLGEYLGIGASSSGYMNNFRYTNHANVKQYLDSIDNNTLPVMLKESVTPEITWTECIMLGLRTRDGVDLEKLKQISNLSSGLEHNFEHFIIKTEKYVQMDLLEKKENAVKCTLKGFLVLDELIMNLVFK
jgi:oxygen-independent coproporphyrinogen-3 oxidase